MSDTPETDKYCGEDLWIGEPALVSSDFARKLERERDEWKAKFIQANKDYGFELMDPCGTIWDHAKRLQQERDEAREALQRITECDMRRSKFIARTALEKH